jgi:antitoxin component YwqK of YwqJK toxin-antitoxin module
MIVIPIIGVFAQISVNELKINCGNNYFITEHIDFSNEPSVVIGSFCDGKAYYWSHVDSNDSLKEIAYFKDVPFTGKAVFTNNQGQTLSSYYFVDGYINQIEFFNENGFLEKNYNYHNGIPHGTNIEYFANGTIRNLFTYKAGILDGPFITHYKNMKIGMYEKGKKVAESEFKNMKKGKQKRSESFPINSKPDLELEGYENHFDY